jgi:CheY-like chemotaxis protein
LHKDQGQAKEEPMRPQLNVLLVEDNEQDVAAIQRHFAPFSQHFPLTVVGDGEAALALLRGQAAQPPLPQPYLILLALSLPRLDGFAFLSELRQDPMLQHTLVFVLTDSAAQADKRAAYQTGIAGYVPKTNLGADYEQLPAFLAAYAAVVQFPEF